MTRKVDVCPFVVRPMDLIYEGRWHLSRAHDGQAAVCRARRAAEGAESLQVAACVAQRGGTEGWCGVVIYGFWLGGREQEALVQRLRGAARGYQPQSPEEAIKYTSF